MAHTKKKSARKVISLADAAAALPPPATYAGALVELLGEADAATLARWHMALATSGLAALKVWKAGWTPEQKQQDAATLFNCAASAEDPESMMAAVRLCEPLDVARGLVGAWLAREPGSKTAAKAIFNHHEALARELLSRGGRSR